MAALIGRLLRRGDRVEPATVTLTLEEARHCQHALAWLAANFLFADAFGPAFIPAAETLAKIAKETDPGKRDLVAYFIAEADQAAAKLAELSRSQ